jgi:hypothetical protein
MVVMSEHMHERTSHQEQIGKGGLDACSSGRETERQSEPGADKKLVPRGGIGHIDLDQEGRMQFRLPACEVLQPNWLIALHHQFR